MERQAPRQPGEQSSQKRGVHPLSLPQSLALALLQGHVILARAAHELVAGEGELEHGQRRGIGVTSVGKLSFTELEL